MSKVSSGINFLDNLLGGGYDKDIVTTIYGPSSSGKTNLCILTAIKTASSGKKVIIIDSEGGIAVERIKQIAGNYEEILEKILFLNPLNFEEQKEIFERLKGLINEQLGIIIVDSISMLYRLELGRTEEVYEVNSSLGKQIAYLVEIARKNKLPVLITNQVYSDFEKKDKVKMVGGDLLKYGSKCLIELQKLDDYRLLTLRKHRSLPEGLEFKFKIVEKGIEEIE